MNLHFDPVVRRFHAIARVRRGSVSKTTQAKKQQSLARYVQSRIHRFSLFGNSLPAESILISFSAAQRLVSFKIVVEKRATHGSAHGTRTTFIKLGSRACRRATHCGPSASGAIAVISGFT